MFKYLALSAALIALPVAAATPAATPAASPSNFGCMLRTMEFSMMAKASSERADAKPEDKAKSAAMSASAREAAYYYLGLLGPKWAASNHSVDGEAEFKAWKAVPQDQRAKEILGCMSAAHGAQEAALKAMAPPAK